MAKKKPPKQLLSHFFLVTLHPQRFATHNAIKKGMGCESPTVPQL